MKKKKIALGKKLQLGKTVVADLTLQEQLQVAGGATIGCATRLITCQTIPYTEQACKLCWEP
ncbi:hypothetical protein LX64_01260 [Chitinophaga skermanii]|uniref:Natural product n=1 Tax=Chitinophaga skermanii TaxID=331697 RepID=A0A327R400_9BACT|nr:class I lanthipeptide [Chitinophaga skermanii]RAJ08607.1 hypothetical protein LX64_01260 [Chitinophaga skermanii]